MLKSFNNLSSTSSRSSTTRLLSASSTSTTAATTNPSLVISQRTGYLLSSYYSRYQFPKHQVPITYRAGSDFRSKLVSSYFSRPAAPDTTTTDLEEQQQRVVEWPWYGGSNPAVEDIVAASDSPAAANNNNSSKNSSAGILSRPKGRNYVPLEHVLQIEFRGDHLLKAGEFKDALKHFGVVVKARQAAYPEGHFEISKSLIKLSRTFRLVGKPESAVANLEKALENVTNEAGNTAPPCEQVCEMLLELGLAKRDLKSYNDAGFLLEDAARIMDLYHDFGGSHRHLRLSSRRAKKLSLNFHNKFEYHPAGNIDRTFSLVNLALTEAEDLYRNVVKDDAGVVRVLQTRSNMIDRKQFNAVFQSGKMRTWRGHNNKKRRFNTSNPTATELLAFSPTIHQVYHDYSRANIAPLGREDEVLVPAGARHLDDGDPYRHVRAMSKGRYERQKASMEMLERRDRGISNANAYEGSEAVQEKLRQQQ